MIAVEETICLYIYERTNIKIVIDFAETLAANTVCFVVLIG